jgi:hypothetical protein
VASAAREEGNVRRGRAVDVVALVSSGPFNGAVDEAAELASSCDCAGGIGLPFQSGSNGITRRPVRVVACESVLVGIERWRCDVDVVGA